MRHPYLAGENKRFLLKIVIFFKSTKMCLMCAHSKFFLSQTKVHYHVIIRCYFYILNVLSLEWILDQNVRRSNFRLCTSFDQRIIYFWYTVEYTCLHKFLLHLLYTLVIMVHRQKVVHPILGWTDHEFKSMTVVLQIR